MTIFIARQHAMHAERDIVVPILSVCLSVRLSVRSMPVLGMSKRVDIVTLLDALVGTSLYNFRSPTAVIKYLRETPSVGA